MKQSDDFIYTVVDSLEVYPHYLSEYERLFEIQTFKMLVDTFDLDTYLNNLILDEETYNLYFKDIVKKYDKPKHKEMKKQFKQTTLKNIYLNDKSGMYRDYILESIFDNEDYWEDDYEKSKIVNFLQYFFDKYGFERELNNGDISIEDYEKYFKDTFLHYNPYKHNELMEKNDEN